MADPLISVIVPVYNVSKYLHQCLDSLAAQTMSNYEVIIIDDGSTDQSGRICDDYVAADVRFKVIHCSNGGLALARELGFQQASGKYVSTVDSDDWVDPTYLENMLSCIEQQRADCVICAYWRNVDGQDTYMANKPSELDKNVLIEEVLKYKYHAGLWNKIFKRSILRNGIICPPRHSYFEDMFTYVSYLQFASNVVYSDCATYHYRYCTESLTNKADLTVRMDMTSQVLNNLLNLYNQYASLHAREKYKALCACANSQKRRLLNEYPYDYRKYRKIVSDILPNSYKLGDVNGCSSMCHYFALKGWGYPIRLVELLKKCLRWHK